MKKIMIINFFVLISMMMYAQQTETTIIGYRAERDSTLQERGYRPSPEYGFAAGDTVIISKDQPKYLTGEKMSEWVYYVCHEVRSVGGRTFPTGVLLDGIMSWTNPEDLLLLAPKDHTQEADARQAADASKIQELVSEIEDMDETTKDKIRRFAESVNGTMLADVKPNNDGPAKKSLADLLAGRGITDKAEALRLADSIATAMGANPNLLRAEALKLAFNNRLNLILSARNITDKDEAIRIANELAAEYEIDPVEARAQALKLAATRRMNQIILERNITDPDEARRIADQIAAEYGIDVDYARAEAVKMAAANRMNQIIAERGLNNSADIRLVADSLALAYGIDNEEDRQQMVRLAAENRIGQIIVERGITDKAQAQQLADSIALLYDTKPAYTRPVAMREAAINRLRIEMANRNISNKDEALRLADQLAAEYGIDPEYTRAEALRLIAQTAAANKIRETIPAQGITAKVEGRRVASDIAAEYNIDTIFAYGVADRAVLKYNIDTQLTDRNVMDKPQGHTIADEIALSMDMGNSEDKEFAHEEADCVVATNMAKRRVAEIVTERPVTEIEVGRQVADSLSDAYGAYREPVRRVADSLVAENNKEIDHISRFTIGARAGVASLMQKAGDSKWQAGFDVLLDLQYAYYRYTEKEHKIGFLVGLSLGYDRNGMKTDSIYDKYKTQTTDGEIEYTIQADDIREKDGNITLEIPVMFSMITKCGFFFNVGPRFQIPVYAHYGEEFRTRNIDAYFTKEHVHVPNELITGKIGDSKSEAKGKFTAAKVNIMLSAELGYEWLLKNNHAISLGAFANYSVYSPYKNTCDAQSIIDLTAPSDVMQPASIAYQSFQDVYGTGLGYFDAGVKLAFHFDYPKAQTDAQRQKAVEKAAKKEAKAAQKAAEQAAKEQAAKEQAAQEQAAQEAAAAQQTTTTEVK